MVRRSLGLTETPGPDAADALAIGLTHLALAGGGAARCPERERKYERSDPGALAGTHGYGDALAMQEELVARKRADHSLGDELLLLEHEPVYTIGRTPDQSSLLGAAHLAASAFPD